MSSDEETQEKNIIQELFLRFKQGTKIPLDFVYNSARLPQELQHYLKHIENEPGFYNEAATTMLQYSTSIGTKWHIIGSLVLFEVWVFAIFSIFFGVLYAGFANRHTLIDTLLVRLGIRVPSEKINQRLKSIDTTKPKLSEDQMDWIRYFLVQMHNLANYLSGVSSGMVNAIYDKLKSVLNRIGNIGYYLLFSVMILKIGLIITRVETLKRTNKYTSAQEVLTYVDILTICLFFIIVVVYLFVGKNPIETQTSFSILLCVVFLFFTSSVVSKLIFVNWFKSLLNGSNRAVNKVFSYELFIPPEYDTDEDRRDFNNMIAKMRGAYNIRQASQLLHGTRKKYFFEPKEKAVDSQHLKQLLSGLKVKSTKVGQSILGFFQTLGKLVPSSVDPTKSQTPLSRSSYRGRPGSEPNVDETSTEEAKKFETEYPLSRPLLSRKIQSVFQSSAHSKYTARRSNEGEGGGGGAAAADTRGQERERGGDGAAAANTTTSRTLKRTETERSIQHSESSLRNRQRGFH